MMKACDSLRVMCMNIPIKCEEKIPPKRENIIKRDYFLIRGNFGRKNLKN